jgi:hypothetical protein
VGHKWFENQSALLKKLSFKGFHGVELSDQDMHSNVAMYGKSTSANKQFSTGISI